MQIIPAIDIKNGKCVRLTQGDFTMEKIYSDNPIVIAKQFKKEGAKMLHLIDLDGAKNGAMENIEIIQQIIKKVTIPVQVGGGIRNIKTVKTLLDIGVERIILGTMAINEQDKLINILSNYPTQVAVAIDVKNGILMQNGWVKKSKAKIIETVKLLENLGVQRFIYTDVVKDGTLTQPNYKEITTIMKNISVPLIVGGGVSNISQIKKLKKLGVEGIILGKALYEKKINLKEANYVS